MFRYACSRGGRQAIGLGLAGGAAGAVVFHAPASFTPESLVEQAQYTVDKATVRTSQLLAASPRGQREFEARPPSGAEMAAVIGAGAVALVLIGGVAMFKKCPPNKMMIVYGLGAGAKRGKIVHGGGTLVVPVFQVLSYIHLRCESHN